ncbi:MAG: nuclear transport factor 2 family protein [Sphingomonadales bacterium]|nr:nuclear transport factor 2 family protein [Sphingomonadales bacterium]
MASSEIAIASLVYRYAELIDSGNFEGAAALFAAARIKIGDREIGSAEVLQLWRNAVIIHEDGTPRTKHVITNPIIEVDEAAGTGTCRTYYTVMQQVGRGPLEAVMCGRYHDSFERIDGQWRFSFRDYSLHDLPGDMSRHSRNWQARAETEEH